MVRSIFDSVFNSIIAGLVHFCFFPRARFVDPQGKLEKFSEPMIIVCNHRSHLDGPILNTIFRKNVIHNLAAKDRFEQSKFGFFLRHTGCIPIDRQKADTSWVYTSLNVLRNDKENIAIYPEGRHAEPRKILPFHSGVSMLAVMAQVPILMVYMDSPHKFWRRTEILVAPPFKIDIPSTGLSADFVEAQTKILQQKMEDLMTQFYAQNAQ